MEVQDIAGRFLLIVFDQQGLPLVELSTSGPMQGSIGTHRGDGI